MIMWGWALAAQGQAEEGLPHMHEGLAASQATGAESRRPWYLGYLAEAYSRSGQTDTALGVLKQALEAATTMQQQLAQAQLYRLKDEVLMQADSKATMVEAEENLRQSLALARRQHAKAWELRAAMSLARIWQRQDKPATARQLLVEVYTSLARDLTPPTCERHGSSSISCRRHTSSSPLL